MDGSLDIFSEDPDSFYTLLNEHQRLKTFDKWPNDPDWNCTPEKLAEAGFFFKPCPDAPDNACCIFCKKELDGWEPDDDPSKEHKKHSPKCPFVSLRKSFEDLTLVEAIKFITKVISFHSEKKFDQKYKDMEATAEKARNILVDFNGAEK